MNPSFQGREEEAADAHTLLWHPPRKSAGPHTHSPQACLASITSLERSSDKTPDPLPPQASCSASLITSSYKSGLRVAIPPERGTKEPLQTPNLKNVSAQQAPGFTLTRPSRQDLEQSPRRVSSQFEPGPRAPRARARPPPGHAHLAPQLARQLARKRDRGNAGVSGEALRACAWRSWSGEGPHPGSERRKYMGLGSSLPVPSLECAMRAEGKLGLQGKVLTDPGLGAADGPVSVCVPRETWSTVWRPRR